MGKTFRFNWTKGHPKYTREYLEKHRWYENRPNHVNQLIRGTRVEESDHAQSANDDKKYNKWDDYRGSKKKSRAGHQRRKFSKVFTRKIIMDEDV